MTQRFLFLIFTLLIFSSTGCEEQPITNDDPDFAVPNILPTGEESYLNNNSDYIFNQDSLYTFELSIPGAALARLDTDPAAEEYEEGMLIFQGDTLSPVGIRYKGSVGAFAGCVSGNDWLNPSGRKTCTKLSMKVKINWEGSDTKFFGLKKLQFHSQNQDPTQLHERLGYWLFRQMGVPAPRSVHARLIVNGEYQGLFALTEQIDGRFTRYNFDDGEGNLYKECWPLTAEGEVHNEQTYLSSLKTNEDEQPSVEPISNFAQEIANSTPSSIQAVIEEWMDVNEVLSYAVVDRTIRHDDGPFHWYCFEETCFTHNFYWYVEPGSGQQHLIAWDLDNAFENILSNSNPITPIRDEWGQTSADCEPFGPFWGIQQRSAACDPLVAGWASFQEEYAALKTTLVEGPLSEAQVNPLIEGWIEQIRTATLEADQSHQDALSISKWEEALSELREQLEFARNN